MKILLLLLIIISTQIYSNQLKNIVIISTGGGISTRTVDSVNAKVREGFLTVEGLVSLVPQINRIANVKTVQLFSRSSQNINNESLIKIAGKVQEMVNDSSVDGVVVTHGTDTLEETAYFLNLVIRTKKPIVVTGATRSSNQISSDAALNLFNSTLVASSSESAGQGVLVVLNNKILSARGTQKIATNGIDSVFANGLSLLGYAFNKTVEFYNATLKKHTHMSEFNVKNDTTLPNVKILFAHQNIDANMVKSFLNKGVDGVVIAGVGNGNISDSAVTVLKKAVENEIVVVKSSRTGNGIILANTEVDDKKIGFVTANNLSPQQARILLMVAMLKTKKPGRLQQFFNQY